MYEEAGIYGLRPRRVRTAYRAPLAPVTATMYEEAGIYGLRPRRVRTA
jgi:hypothetical protein